MIELAIESAGPATRRVLLDVAGQPRHGASRCPRRTSTRGWRGGTCPSTDPLTSGARRRLASSRTSEYMQRNRRRRVADCIRVIGWRLDPHGVTASGAFSASSIEDWRAVHRELAHATERQPVLIAVSILLDGRIDLRAGARLDVKRAALRDRRPRDPRALDAEAGAGREAADRVHARTSSSRAPGSTKGTFDIKHGGLLPIVDLARYARARGRASRATPTLDRLRAAADEGRAGQDGGPRARGGLRAVQRPPTRASGRSRSSRAASPTTTSTRGSSTRSPRGTCGTHSGRSRRCSDRAVRAESLSRRYG